MKNNQPEMLKKSLTKTNIIETYTIHNIITKRATLGNKRPSSMESYTIHNIITNKELLWEI